MTGNWRSNFSSDARTAYWKHGSYQKMADEYGVSKSTAQRWVKQETADPSAANKAAFEKMQEDKQEWLQDDDAMWEITETANEKKHQQEVKKIKDAIKAGEESEEGGQAEIEDLEARRDEFTREEWEDAYRLARDSGDPDNWEDFRRIHESRGGS